MPTTIYILGNLQTFVAALTGIQMIFNPANNTDWAMGGAMFGVGPIVTIGLLVSMLHITTKGVWTQKLSLHHVGILLGLYAAMFIPTTNVTVQDLYTGQSQIVDGVPIGVAYPASIVSQLSYDAATQLGQAFQTVSATQPPTNIATGMAAPLRTMLQLRNMYVFFSKEQPGLARAEVLFVKQCVYPNAAFNNWWQQINQSNNILNTYAGFAYPSTATSEVPYDATLASSGANITCTAGGNCSASCGNMAVAIDAAFQKWLSNSQSSGLGCSNAAGMSTAANAESNTPTADCTGAGSFGSILSAMGSSGTEYVSMIVNSCINSVGMASGPDVNALPQVSGQSNDYCTITTNSMSQAQVDNAGASNVFLANMLPLMSILQFLFIALAPLAAFTMVMAAEQGVTTFIKYIMFGLWTQSWLPVAAIINDYAQITIEHQFAVLAAAATASAGAVGSSMTNALNALPVIGAGQDALTTTSLPILIQQTMQVLSNADMMLAMTPVITMIVFTGSYFGMAQLAQGVGGEDNVSKNTGLTTPGLSAQEKDFGVSAQGTPQGTFQVNTAYGTGLTYTGSQGASYLEGASNALTTGASQSYGTKVGQTANEAVQFLQAHKNDLSAALDNKQSASHDFATAYKQTQDWAHTHSLDENKALNFALAYNSAYKSALSANGGDVSAAQAAGLAAGNAAAGLKGQEAAKYDNAMKDSEQVKTGNGLTFDNAAKFVSSVGNDSKDSQDKSEAASISGSLQDTKSAEASYQKSLQEANALKKEASSMTNGQASAGVTTKLLSTWAQHDHATPSVALARVQGIAQAAGMGEVYQQEVANLSTGEMRGADSLDIATTAVMRLAQRNGAIGSSALMHMYNDNNAQTALEQGQALRDGVQAAQQQTRQEVGAGQASLAPAGNAATQGGQTALDHKAMATQGPANFHDPRAAGAADPGQVYAGQSGSIAETAAGHLGLSPQAQKLEDTIDGNLGMKGAQWAAKHPYEAMALGALVNAAGPLLGTAAGSALMAGLKSTLARVATEAGTEAGMGSLGGTASTSILGADVGGLAAAGAAGVGVVAAGVTAAAAAGYGLGKLIDWGTGKAFGESASTALGNVMFDLMQSSKQLGETNQVYRGLVTKGQGNTPEAAQARYEATQMLTAHVQQAAQEAGGGTPLPGQAVPLGALPGPNPPAALPLAQFNEPPPAAAPQGGETGTPEGGGS